MKGSVMKRMNINPWVIIVLATLAFLVVEYTFGVWDLDAMGYMQPWQMR
jgi:hypothetical protein